MGFRQGLVIAAFLFGAASANAGMVYECRGMHEGDPVYARVDSAGENNLSLTYSYRSVGITVKVYNPLGFERLFLNVFGLTELSLSSEMDASGVREAVLRSPETGPNTPMLCSQTLD